MQTTALPRRAQLSQAQLQPLEHRRQDVKFGCRASTRQANHCSKGIAKLLSPERRAEPHPDGAARLRRIVAPAQSQPAPQTRRRPHPTLERPSVVEPVPGLR